MLLELYSFFSHPIRRSYISSSIIRKAIKVFVHVYYPFLFSIYLIFPSLLNRRDTLGRDLVVSFTSFPPRISSVWMVIISILLQNGGKPSKLVLYLSSKEFSSIEVLPKSLKRLISHNLVDIRIVEYNLRSHKKYFYALLDFPESDIITIDDDIIYPKNIISNLLDNRARNGDTIVANFGKEITFENGKINSYINWKEVVSGIRYSYKIIPIGAGGCYYPKGCFHSYINNANNTMNIAPSADDLWLWVHFRLNHKGISIPKRYYGLVELFSLKDVSLNRINIEQLGNDKQMKAIQDYVHSVHNKDLIALCL